MDCNANAIYRRHHAGLDAVIVERNRLVLQVEAGKPVPETPVEEDTNRERGDGEAAITGLVYKIFVNPMLGSPEGLVRSRFVIDIAEGMRSGLNDATTYMYSQTKRGGDNLFDSRFHCRIDERLFSHHELLLHYEFS